MTTLLFIAYIAYAYIQAVFVVRSLIKVTWNIGENDAVGYTMTMTLFAPLVSLWLIVIGFYLSTIYLLKVK